jgi:aspartyl-tRNA(Asn)/glutamyl-tRNA(Gln) amidotransferase subunit A
MLDYLAAVNARGDFGVAMREFHTRYDLLLTPSLAVPAFGVGRLEPEGSEGEDWTNWTPFTYPFNLTQQPACSVPCGFTDNGLPVGLQIVGPMHADALVLRAARAFESARPWTATRPDLP